MPTKHEYPMIVLADVTYVFGSIVRRGAEDIHRSPCLTWFRQYVSVFVSLAAYVLQSLSVFSICVSVSVSVSVSLIV